MKFIQAVTYEAEFRNSNVNDSPPNPTPTPPSPPKFPNVENTNPVRRRT